MRHILNVIAVILLACSIATGSDDTKIKGNFKAPVTKNAMKYKAGLYPGDPSDHPYLMYLMGQVIEVMPNNQYLVDTGVKGEPIIVLFEIEPAKIGGFHNEDIKVKSWLFCSVFKPSAIKTSKYLSTRALVAMLNPKDDQIPPMGFWKPLDYSITTEKNCGDSGCTITYAQNASLEFNNKGVLVAARVPYPILEKLVTLSTKAGASFNLTLFIKWLISNYTSPESHFGDSREQSNGGSILHNVIRMINEGEDAKILELLSFYAKTGRL